MNLNDITTEELNVNTNPKTINLNDWYDYKNHNGRQYIRILFMNDKINSNFNGFLSLIHELSHVKYDLFLIRYTNRILSYKPVEIIKNVLYSSTDKPSVLFLNTDLDCLLKERHALENEYRYLKLTLNYFDTIPLLFINYFKNPETRVLDEEFEDNYKLTFGKIILSEYIITDPNITPFIHKSIYQVFHLPLSKISQKSHYLSRILSLLHTRFEPLLFLKGFLK